MNYIVVTNTLNRPLQLVERSLRASLKQKIPPIKVVLIDQNNTPLELSPDIKTHPLFQVQRTNVRSVSAARNGLMIPENVEWVFFCDDDGYPCEDYSEKLNKIIFDNDNLEILAGSIVRDDNSEFYSLRHKKGGSLKYFRNTKNLMGSNFVIKIKTFLELGKFDENFGVGSCWGSSEETDLCWNAYFRKCEMEFYPELMVYHVPPFNESLKGGAIKAFYYGIGKGALVYKWLVKKKKLKTIFELVEMLIVPIIQSIRAVFVLKPQLIISNIAALVGRIVGFFRAMFLMK
jgi:GT2 family glycosyltransferase